MTIHVFGSINLDHVYRVSHFPQGGETLAAREHSVGLGGKGANQAIAAASAGAQVEFVGAVGEEGLWARTALADRGVGVAGVNTVADSTGHAIIYVDDAAENQIVIYGGANQSFKQDQLFTAIASTAQDDIWLVQNETNLTAESLQEAKRQGRTTAYAAAPFDPVAATAALPHTDILFVNEGEDAALKAHLGTDANVLIKVTTLGSKGARIDVAGAEPIFQLAFEVTPLDTTGAGDTFTGAFLAKLDAGAAHAEAARYAAAAAALCVTRLGAANAIPTQAEIEAFLGEHA